MTEKQAKINVRRHVINKLRGKHIFNNVGSESVSIWTLFKLWAL